MKAVVARLRMSLGDIQGQPGVHTKVWERFQIVVLAKALHVEARRPNRNVRCGSHSALRAKTADRLDIFAIETDIHSESCSALQLECSPRLRCHLDSERIAPYSSVKHMVSFDESPRVLSGPEGSALTASVAASLAASKLRLCTALDDMLRMAVELARESLGLERVAFYLRDPDLREPRAERVVLRGTWGTGARGETTDERHLSHELSVSDGAALQKLRATGSCSLYRPRARWYAADPEGAVLLGEGWVMVTPLVHEGDLVGVMYNDAALTGSPLNPSQQAAAALLATFVTIEYGARVGPVRWQPLRSMEAPSAFVRKIREAVDRDLSIRGNELAQAFGVSAGYLARAFKREMDGDGTLTRMLRGR